MDGRALLKRPKLFRSGSHHMLGSFRRFTNSKLGAVVAFIVLGVIALAFAAGDITGLGGGVGGLRQSEVAEVGNQKITETELIAQAKNALRGIQQEQPTADMAGFLAANGVERVLEQLIDRRSAAMFAHDQGMIVSDRAVEGVIASIPAFRGPDGKFSQAAYEQALSQQRITDRDVREDIARERLIQFLTAPANGGAKVGRDFALPYASLLLERRKGSIATIPAAALPAGPAPTDAELNAFYKANIRRYTVPERRVVRYAIVTPESVKAASAPTEADLQAAYKADPARFAASEKRNVQVVVVLDQASATNLANQAKGGAALDAAARALGLEARTLAAVDKTAVAAQTAPAVADAIFGAAQGAVVGPVRGGGGFTVAKVIDIQKVAATPFEQARTALLPEVLKSNQAARLARLNEALDTAAAEGATFDELVRDQKLTAAKTAPLMQNGMDPLNLKAAPDPQLAAAIQAGFASEQGDAPQIVPVGTDGGFALVALDSIQPAAPRALAEVKADVARALQLQRAQAQARKIAADVVAKADRGTPLGAALSATGLKLPALRAVELPRAALAASPQGAEPPLALMFAMAAKRAKMLEMPNGAGWQVVWLDEIIPGDAAKDPRMLSAAQADLNRVAGRELVQQFGRALRDAAGVKRNPQAIAAAKAQLSGQSPDAQP